MEDMLKDSNKGCCKEQTYHGKTKQHNYNIDKSLKYSIYISLPFY